MFHSVPGVPRGKMERLSARNPRLLHLIFQQPPRFTGVIRP
jgi:hypothetical protein